MESGTDWLCEILQTVQLEHFYLPIRDQLQITRLAHFDYVHAEDLERIGISKPGIRRLLDAVRKKKLQQWNRKFWNKLFGSSSSATKEKADLALKPQAQSEPRTTCIILEKDLIYRKQGQMSIEAGDSIILIDKRAELHWWKGQNQRTLVVGLFPSNIVTVAKSKTPMHIKKAQTLSPSRRVSNPSTIVSSDDAEVILRKRRTIESTQPASTRAGNSASKHFNYNKLINDRTLLNERVARAARDNQSKSLNQVREDLLIDLDLPPSTNKNSPGKASAIHNISILDEPIDIPEVGQADWGQSIESLPTYSANTNDTQTYPNLYGARSLDALNVAVTSVDPFDLSTIWPVTQNSHTRPNYDIHPGNITTHESQIPTSYSHTQTYNTQTMPYVSNNQPNNALSLDKYSSDFNPVKSLAQMSLDDRISESLNLRSKNTNYDNIYSNCRIENEPSTSSGNVIESREDIPVYQSFDANPAQEQFIRETKDYYTKFSTPASQNSSNYEKNIYVPKYDESEKLGNFSESVENSKNYSALKYQNFNQYSSYGYGASSSRGYDEVNDAESNCYSEIDEDNRYARATYANAGLYDDVYEPTLRPHRPAPPCPSKPK
ncbi:unnamed protein product [Leptidea sinapis]|uniref:non-specific protein-tyrosine kinase n=1 Tax=Leptidea sinapis TaxID=189913 RepID=A0A5E4Q519_9NEOP|nr:unnamed protein product [Leptidea sinapis]